jgi:hypothetical protein
LREWGDGKLCHIMMAVSYYVISVLFVLESVTVLCLKSMRIYSF